MLHTTVNNRNNYSIHQEGDVFRLDNISYRPDFRQINASTYQIMLDNQVFMAHLVKEDRSGKKFEFLINNQTVTVDIHHKFDLKKSLKIQGAEKRYLETYKSPMPGLIVDVLVKDGEKVIDGQPLLILKAMKMENILRAPHDATIRRVLVIREQRVNKEDVLIQF